MSTFPGAFVPVAPPADGLRLAFVAARRRRNRKAGAAGAAGLLAVVALLASSGGSGDRSLLQQPLPPSSGNGLGVVVDVDPSAAPSTPPAAATTTVVGPGELGRAGSGASRSGRTGSTVAAAGTTSAGYRTEAGKPISQPMTRGTSLGYTNGDLICPARKQQEGQRSLCTDVSAYQTSAGLVTISAEICNVGTASDVLSFDTARELDLRVKHTGIEVWRWSTGRHFAPTPHDIVVGAQQCITWNTQWSQVDAHGVKVKGGSYDIVADFDAAEVAEPDRHPSYPLTIS